MVWCPRRIVRFSPRLVLATMFCFGAMGAEQAVGQGFLEELGKLLAPSPESAPEIAIEPQERGPEIPVPFSSDPSDKSQPENTARDAIERLPATRERNAGRLLLQAREALSQLGEDTAEARKKRDEAIRELEAVVAEDPDSFIWTNYERWTSVHRLARELLHDLTASTRPQPIRQADLNKAALSKVARLALRTPSKATADRLRQSWLAARRDAGHDLLAKTYQSGTPERSPLADASVDVAKTPVTLPQWVRTTSSQGWRNAVNNLRKQREEDHESLIPASQVTLANGLALWRTSTGLQAVDLELGSVRWSIRLPDSFDVAAENITKLAANRTFNIGNWRSSATNESHFAHALLSGGATTAPSADDRFAYLVVDPATYSAELTGQRNRFRAIPDDSNNGDFSSNLLRAIDLKTGRTVWEIGGPALRDQFERPFAGMFFLGPPAIAGQQLYVLTESRGEIELQVLDARDGSLLWSQPLTATQLTIDQDLSRRFWSLSPMLVDGVAICPTGVGWVCAVTTDGRELLWASRVAEPARATSRFNYYSIGSVDNRWRPSTPIIDGTTAWVFPPDSTEPTQSATGPKFYEIDLLTGEPLIALDRDNALAPVALQETDGPSKRLVWVGRHTVGADIISNLSSRAVKTTAWSHEFGQGRTITGRPAAMGAELHVPVDGRELWTFRIDDGSIVKRRPYDGDGDLGNLTVVAGSLLSCSPTSLVRLQNEEQLVQPSSDDVSEKLAVARVTGNPELALSVLQNWASQPADSSLNSQEVGIRNADRSEKLAFLNAAAATITEIVAENGTVSQDVIARLETLVDSPADQLPIERFRVLSDWQAGQRVAAAKRLISLAGRSDLPTVMVSTRDRVGDLELSPRDVRFDRWLMAAFADLWTELTPADRVEVNATLTDAKLAELSTEALTLIARSSRTHAELKSRLNESALTTAAKIAAARRITAAGTDRREWEPLYSAIAPQTVEPTSSQRPSWNGLDFQTDILGMVGTRMEPTRSPILTDDLIDNFADRYLTVSSRLQACLVESASTGRLVASLPLGSRSRVSYGLQTSAWSDNDMLFVVSHGKLHAYRTDSWPLLWSREVAGNSAFYRTESDRVVGFVSPRDLSDQAHPRFSAVVALGPDVVVIRDRSSLLGLSRETGEELWRRDSNSNEEVLGDVHEGLILRAGPRWRVVRFVDGASRLLDIAARPDHFVATTAGKLITINPEGYSGPVRVVCSRLANGPSRYTVEEEWSHELSKESLAALVAASRIAVFDEQFRFSIVDLVTGHKTPPVTLPSVDRPERPNGLREIIDMDDELLVVSNARDRRNHRAYHVDGKARQVDGALVSIDSDTGKIRWSQPEILGSLLWGASRQSPALLLLNRDVATYGSTSITTFQIRGLSRETGDELFSIAPRLAENDLQEINFDPIHNTLTLALPNTRIRITATSPQQLPAD